MDGEDFYPQRDGYESPYNNNQKYLKGGDFLFPMAGRKDAIPIKIIFKHSENRRLRWIL